MFIWDFSAVVAVILIIGLGIVFGMWVFYTFTEGPKSRERAESGFFCQCNYCGHVYLDYFKRAPSRCPRCGSYHD